ncbi:MAG: hypothetical protein KAQ98_01940 [Bacteriovoracaceae bacterium]|nr:hypothetical protein [Bacteriovoracaceae bacterium]
MAMITVNSKEINHNINTQTTINEIIDMVLDTAENDNNVVTDLTVDGKQVDVYDNDEKLKTTVGDFQEINLTVKSSLELAFEALDSCTHYIDVVMKKIDTLTSLYSENEIMQANALFAEVIEIMDLFIQLMTKIHRSIRTHTKDNFNKAPVIQDLEIHLLSILKALIPAKERNDLIMLCDLLEYELMDNLKRWKINAIPELKKYKTQ